MSRPPEADTPMESPTSLLTRRKLGRWLLLLSVATVALGGFVWWKSRSERLQFVETIWLDSSAKHERDVSTGQRQKTGEMWSLTRSSGLRLFGHGLTLEFEGQYPVFEPANPFLQAVSDQLLIESREAAFESTQLSWSMWWDSLHQDWTSGTWWNSSCLEVVFVSDRAVSFCQTVGEYTGGAHPNYEMIGRNFVERDGEPHEIVLAELLNGSEWVNVLSDLCLDDLRRQGASSVVSDAITKLNVTDLSCFALTRTGMIFYFAPYAVGPYSDGSFEVFIPYEKLADHLRPDGLHRAFQIPKAD